MNKISDLFTKYNCTNCQDDINGIRVHCAECENFDLCLPCFGTGAEIGGHHNTHAYQFMDTGTAVLSVYRGKGAWTAREEIRLLDSVEKYGFGNWEDVSKHIETKTPEEAKEEYVNKFVKGTMGCHTWSPAQAQRPVLVDHTTEDTGPLGDAAFHRILPLDITAEESAQLGYMPNRDGFEREYDPAAEQLISSISLSSDDSEADYLLKLAHVDMYTRRQRERVRRKRLVRDYQLVANFFRNRNYALYPGLSREQKDFRDRFRVFAQFYTCNEYDRLLASLEREKELRIRLSELFRYRHNGLTKIDDCRHFEQHAAMATNRSTGPYGHAKTDNTIPNTGSPQPQDSSVLSPPCNSNNNSNDQVKESEEKSNFIVPKSMPRTVAPIYSGASLRSKNFLGSYQALSNPMNMLGMTPKAMLVAAKLNLRKKQLMQNLRIITAQTKPLENLLDLKKSEQIQNTDIVKNAILNKQKLQVRLKQQIMHVTKLQELHEIQHMQDMRKLNQTEPNLTYIKPLSKPEKPAPVSNTLRAQLDELKDLKEPLGTDLLTTNEQKLCKIFNLSPTKYISLKTLLLSGAPLPSNLSHVENSLRRYFIKVGWLTSD